MFASFVALGCGSGSSAEPAQSGNSETSATTGSSVGGSSRTSSQGEDASTGTPPPVDCPALAEQTVVDGLLHRGRAEGDTFIEILDLQSRDERIYSCTATQGITIWDASSPSPTLLVENVGPPGLAHPQFPRCQHLGLDPDSNRAVITNRGDEVQPDPWLFLYDLSDPSQPQPLRGWSTDASIEGAVIGGSRIYAAAHTEGIVVLEDRGGNELVPIGSLRDTSSDAWQPLLVGDILYVAEGATGLRIYDVGDDDPVLLATLALPGSSKDLVLDQDTLYVAASSSIVSVDVSTPSAPAIITDRPVQGTAVALALGRDGLLYTAEWDEVRAYDTRDPALPRVWSEAVPTGDDFSRVLTVETDAETGRMFAGEWTGMHAYDAQPDPTGPDIVVSPLSVQFGKVEPGDTADRVYVVHNDGDQTLQVTGVDSDWSSVTLDEACFEVEPGGAFAIEARFAPQSNSINAGRIRLQTNDPDEPEYVLRFAGNASGADVGDPMPDFVLQDLQGNTWERSELEGKVVLLAYFATF